ncbi:ABC-2 transporter permease [Ileibacterium valens]|uniref:ABC-2 transporter permease n=1 Tax=Ileibacterium valens TaxID=1862668 RepID=UPI0023554998|nr:ABC-2 transporter permease [Ileibacterium valens]
MKGLFTLDLQFLISQKRLFMVFLFIMAAFVFGGDSNILMSMAPLLIIIILIRSLLIEVEANNARMLFTMPFSRKDFVIEKYALIFGGAFLAQVIVLWISSFILKTSEAEFTGQILLQLLIISIPASILIPINLKFKSNSQIVTMFLSMALVLAVISLMEYQDELVSFFGQIDHIHPIILTASGVILIILFISVSMLISYQIVKSEEF